MPSITSFKNKHGETRYVLRAYLGTDKATGKRIRVARSGFESEREALLEYARLVLEQEEKGLKKDSPIKFIKVYESWLEGYRHTVKESTLKKTTDAFRLHILPELGDMIIKNITVAEAQAAVNKWHDKLVNFRMVTGYASGILKEAMRQRIIEHNPFDLVIMPKAKPKSRENVQTINYYDKDELLAFLAAVKEDEGRKWYTFFRLLAFTGIRKGEALALSWKDIDFSKGLLTINKTLSLGMENQFIIQEPKTKNGERTISVDKRTIAELEVWKKEQLKILKGFGLNPFKNRQLIFTTLKNDYIPLPQPGHVVNRVCRNNTLRRIKVHGFRHSHCSLLFEAGMTIKEVQDRLGHADIQTTMNIYTHVTQKKRDQVADRFAEFVNY